MSNTDIIKNIDRQPNHHIPVKTWIGMLGAMLGAFMAVLDIQITSSSLAEIQATLGATLEESSWISTAYLVAEVVVIPLTGWLSKIFSIRRYLLTNTILFIIFSIACAWSVNLQMMIVCRALQGFTGGILIPMALTIVLTTLPPSKQTIGMAMFAITATFAPSIGPTLGGWITDNLSWQYNFYLNIIPGIIMISAIGYAIKPTPLHLEKLREGDWGGIITMAIGLGSLEILLEEGNRKDWFSSEFIIQLTIISIVFLSTFLWLELTTKRPFINLRLLKRRNFGIGSLVALPLGLGLYGSIYLLPLYLSQIQRYTAMQIGEVIMISGVPQLFIIPFVPKILQRFDARLVAAVGFSLFATSCFMNSSMTYLTGIDQLRWSQLVRAIGQPLMMVPLTSITTGNIEPEQAGSASGLFNMLRNLGGSIGIALLSTIITWREQFHSNRIGDNISLLNPATQQRIEELTQFFISKGADAITAQNQALTQIANIVRREAYIMAYNDGFYLVGFALLLSGIVLLFCKPVKPGSGAGAH